MDSIHVAQPDGNAVTAAFTKGQAQNYLDNWHGELPSVRDLAKIWQWSKSRVDRFVSSYKESESGQEVLAGRSAFCDIKKRRRCRKAAVGDDPFDPTNRRAT
jgi:hypothetical protein